MALRFENLHDKIKQMDTKTKCHHCDNLCHHACFIISFVPLSTNVYKGISFAVNNSSIMHTANYIMHFKENYNIQYAIL